MDNQHTHTSMLEVALHISTSLNLSVFPCLEKDVGKKRAKAPYTINGYKDASKDEDKIRHWWKQFPNALVGVPTGKTNGIFVVDIDVGTNKEGESSFAALDLGDPKTCQTLTVSGGRHIIFEYPEGYILKSTAGALGKNIDTRGEGGYVIWAGSKLPVGNYAYRPGFEPELGFNSIPPELLEKLSNKEKKSNKLKFSGSIPEGERNDTFFNEAVNLAGKGVSHELIGQYAKKRANDCEAKFDEDEMWKTVENGIRYGKENTPAFTDLGNAERFARDHEGDVIYCLDQRIWYCWDGTRWTPNNAKIQQMAKETARNMLVEPTYGEDHRTSLVKWQKQSESHSKIKSMIDLASSEQSLVKRSSDLDRNLHLFNAFDGTLNLQSGEIKKADRLDFITSQTDSRICSQATCPKWKKFIDEVMCGDQALIAYLQQLCGYIMSGDRGEQIIVYFLGQGANGKSVLIDVLTHVFGDYAGSISAKALIDRASGAIPSDIASIAGKRLVTMSEFPERTYINTTTVKSVTGGDTITARHLYKDWFEFKPQFQLVCAMNELPKVSENDEAYWRRVRIIPFQRTFSRDEMDRNLQDKLKEEADGILQWCVEGARLYQENGLRPTTVMNNELEEYRRKSDPVAEFIRECVITESGQKFYSVGELITHARQYMIQEDMTIPDEAAIKKSLTRMLGETKQHRTQNGRVRGYFGLKVCIPGDDDVPF